MYTLNEIGLKLGLYYVILLLCFIVCIAFMFYVFVLNVLAAYYCAISLYCLVCVCCILIKITHLPTYLYSDVLCQHEFKVGLLVLVYVLGKHENASNGKCK